MKPGNIGVMLSDRRDSPRLLRYVEPVTWRMGSLGLFEPLDDTGARLELPLSEFWCLLDAL